MYVCLFQFLSWVLLGSCGKVNNVPLRLASSDGVNERDNLLLCPSGFDTRKYDIGFGLYTRRKNTDRRNFKLGSFRQNTEGFGRNNIDIQFFRAVPRVEKTLPTTIVYRTPGPVNPFYRNPEDYTFYQPIFLNTNIQNSGRSFGARIPKHEHLNTQIETFKSISLNLDNALGTKTDPKKNQINKKPVQKIPEKHTKNYYDFQSDSPNVQSFESENILFGRNIFEQLKNLPDNSNQNLFWNNMNQKDQNTGNIQHGTDFRNVKMRESLNNEALDNRNNFREPQIQKSGPQMLNNQDLISANPYIQQSVGNSFDYRVPHPNNNANVENYNTEYSQMILKNKNPSNKANSFIVQQSMDQISPNNAMNFKELRVQEIGNDQYLNNPDVLLNNYKNFLAQIGSYWINSHNGPFSNHKNQELKNQINKDVNLHQFRQEFNQNLPIGKQSVHFETNLKPETSNFKNFGSQSKLQFGEQYSDTQLDKLNNFNSNVNVLSFVPEEGLVHKQDYFEIPNDGSLYSKYYELLRAAENFNRKDFRKNATRNPLRINNFRRNDIFHSPVSQIDSKVAEIQLEYLRNAIKSKINEFDNAKLKEKQDNLKIQARKLKLKPVADLFRWNFRRPVNNQPQVGSVVPAPNQRYLRPIADIFGRNGIFHLPKRQKYGRQELFLAKKTTDESGKSELELLVTLPPIDRRVGKEEVRNVPQNVMFVKANPNEFRNRFHAIYNQNAGKIRSALNGEVAIVRPVKEKNRNFRLRAMFSAVDPFQKLRNASSFLLPNQIISATTRSSTTEEIGKRGAQSKISSIQAYSKQGLSTSDISNVNTYNTKVRHDQYAVGTQDSDYGPPNLQGSSDQKLSTNSQVVQESFRNTVFPIAYESIKGVNAGRGRGKHIPAQIRTKENIDGDTYGYTTVPERNRNILSHLLTNPELLPVVLQKTSKEITTPVDDSQEKKSEGNESTGNRDNVLVYEVNNPLKFLRNNVFNQNNYKNLIMNYLMTESNKGMIQQINQLQDLQSRALQEDHMNFQNNKDFFKHQLSFNDYRDGKSRQRNLNRMTEIQRKMSIDPPLSKKNERKIVVDKADGLHIFLFH